MPLPISGFSAVPNPIMPPFMGLQSYQLMGYAALAWQGYKRIISALPKDATPEQIMSEMKKYRQIINTQVVMEMEPLMVEQRKLTPIIVKEFINLINEILEQAPKQAFTQEPAFAGDVNRALGVEGDENVLVNAFAALGKALQPQYAEGAQFSSYTEHPPQELPQKVYTSAASHGLSSHQTHYYKKIDNMSFTEVSDQLKLYAEKKLDPRLQHKMIGEKLLQRYNSQKRSAYQLKTSQKQMNTYETGLNDWKQILSNHFGSIGNLQALNKKYRKFVEGSYNSHVKLSYKKKLDPVVRDLKSAKKEYYNFLRISMNSKNHLIKKQAANLYKKRI